MKSLTTEALTALAAFACLVITLLFTALPSGAETRPDIPEVLKPWKSWVLHGKEYMTCPRACNASEDFFCIWPDILDLDFSESGGTFKQTITVFSSSPVFLPGDRTLRPLSVTVNDQPAPVLVQNGSPCVFLEPGTHALSGRFSWTTLPAVFPVPDHSALISLRVNGLIQPAGPLDSENRLWIRKIDHDANPAKDVDSLTVSVYRLLSDDHPMTLETQMELSVSGGKRREKLTFSLPDQARVVSIDSPLPLKLLEDGTMWVDVNAGTWPIKILAVITPPVSSLGPLSTPYDEEIWAFKPRPELRTVSLDGVQAVDPSQTDMPRAWQSFSAYRITDKALIRLNESRRGAPAPGPDALSLSREIWLDFDGKGATLNDSLSGTLNSRRFLALDDPAYTLGRLTSQGKDQLITRLDDWNQGIELERGSVAVGAVSRLKGPFSGKPLRPGWNNDFEATDLTLNLPPGWSVLGVSGARAEADSTWLNRWSMLDLFLILVLAYGALKLWNPLWGLIFLCGLVLIHHENLSPFYLWAALLLLALLIRFRAGRGGTRARTLTALHSLMLGIVIVSSGLFALSQIRTALWPHLAPWTLPSLNMDLPIPKPSMFPASREPLTESASRIMDTMMESDLESPTVMTRKAPPAKKIYRLSSENIITQTGPAIPSWEKTSITMQTGQIPTSHTLTVRLLSPAQNALFCLVRVFLVLVMIIKALPLPFPNRIRSNRHETTVCLALLSALVTALTLAGPRNAGADIPSPQLLSELEQRLTEAPDCFPDCASVSDLTLTLPDEATGPDGKQFLRMDFTVHAAIRTAIPLPSGLGTWEVYDLSLDKTPHRTVLRKEGTAWALVPQGVHRISLRGMGLDQSRFRFGFPLTPALIRIEAKHWDIVGLNPNLQAPNGLIATRIRPLTPSSDQETTGSERPLADFIRVTRSLSLEREWTAVTTVTRLSARDTQNAVMVDLPLIPGEMVKTDKAGLGVEEKRVRITLSPGQQSLSWESTLPITEHLILSVPADASWSETWSLDASSRWHLTSQGPPMVHENNRGHSTWYPLPGEELKVLMTRLDPADGVFFTIDSASVDYTIDKGTARLTLSCRLRTSKGQTFSIPTPDNCIVKSLRVSGRDFPVAGTPGALDIPLPPGEQTLDIEWSQAGTWGRSFIERLITPELIVVPAIDLGQDVANIRVSLTVPDRSWLVYTQGPAWGPAVLTWGLWFLVLIAAVFLGRLVPTPLGVISWMILGLGLVSVSIPQTLVVAGWFLVMAHRKNKSPASPLLYNLMQIGLFLWTAVVLFSLYQTVATGLLQAPDMHVSGNGSTGDFLIWTKDRASGPLPSPWVAVYSIQTWHVLMLAWSLWLAIHLPGWFRFAWVSLKADGWFRPFGFARGKKPLK